MTSEVFLNALRLIETGSNTNELENLLIKHPRLYQEISQSNKNLTLLFHAVINKHTAAVRLLLEKGSDTEIKTGQYLRTPLELAFNQNSVELMQLLLEHNANPNVCDDQKRSLLLRAVIKKNLSIADLLLRHGADPYQSPAGEHKNPLLKALDTKQEDLFELLIGNYPITHTIFSMIKNNTPSRAFSDHLEKNAHQLDQKAFEVLFLFCTNHKKFETAKLLYHHSRQLLPSKAPILMNGFKQFREPRILSHLIFPGTMSDDRKTALTDAFSKVFSLLINSPLCLELLKTLDDSIADIAPEIPVDFSTVLPGDGFFWNSIKWPSAPQKPEGFRVNCYGLLRYLLRLQLQKHGIEVEDSLHTFSNFVKPRDANPLVFSGALFKEQFFLGSALIHGLYSHYLQWYTLSLALEKGILNFNDGITLLDLLKASVEVTMNKIPIWKKLIDFDIPYSSHEYHPHFGSPFQLNATLLCTETLPHLRGYLLTIWYNSFYKLQNLVREKFNLEIDYDIILLGQLLTGAVYTRFNLDITQEDIEQHYQKNPETNVIFDKTTGILVKKASDRFLHWQSSDLISRLGLFQQARRLPHEIPGSSHSSSSANSPLNLGFFEST